ncbi:probable G-protein coupled receptor 139 [Narcine bancroftii]|uniref:probable G-protein coupled receptor 139 n=1 Tax=Narcine bancroftii TaxID=1343680 RepID=UPI0038315590
MILSRGKCGLSMCTTRYLVAMAAADLLTIITEVILYRVNIYYFPMNFLFITPVCSVVYVLVRQARDCSVWFTVTFTFDRFVAICCQKLKTKYCSAKIAATVLGTTSMLLFSKNIPFYFTLHSSVTIDNVPWGCEDKPSYYTESAWVGFDWFDTALIPLLPFTLILSFNALTVKHILVSSRIRKGLKGKSKSENRSDPEMESRRKSVILLFTLSGSFIVMWMADVLEFLYYTIARIDPNNYTNSELVFNQVGTMLQNLNCCTNTFIYVVTQSKFREHLKSMAKYPVNAVIKIRNK